jgi:hypothetical protein
VGYFAEFAGFWAASPEDQVSAVAALERAGFKQGLERDGWCWARHPSGGEFEFTIDGFVTEIARIAAGPAIGGWIFDSSLAVVAGAEPEGEGFRLTINDVTGLADEEDAAAASWAQTTSSPEAIARSADLLARWSRHAPRRVAAATIIEWTPGVAVLKPRQTQRVHPPPDPERAGLFFGGANPWRTYAGEAYWKFAEDGVRLLFSLLGFPAFGETARAEQEPGADVEPAFGEGPPPLTDEQIALMKSVDAPHIVAGWRDWDGPVERDDWWEAMHESGWQSLNRHWVYAADVMRGQREYALLPAALSAVPFRYASPYDQVSQAGGKGWRAPGTRDHFGR